MRQARVVVIGAGSAGLSSAARLSTRFHDPQAVLVLERGEVAQSWLNRYRELRLNTTRGTSGLPGRPIPRAAGRWPTRDAYIDYLQAAAAGMNARVVTGVEVQRIAPATGDGWVVHTEHSDVAAEVVVVATGHDAVPVEPEWPGRDRYTGRAIHSSEVQALSDFAGQRVVIVGAGNTGIDIAGHLATLGAHVTVCVRTPPTVLPREHSGLALQPLAVATRRLPLRARDVLAQLTSRATIGRLDVYGLPRPRQGPYTRFAATGVTIAVDSGFTRALKTGRIHLAAAATGWTDHGVLTADGRTLDADIVILATGYRADLDPLLGHLNVLDRSGKPHPRRRFQLARLGLHFAGFDPAVEGTLRRHRLDARRIDRALTRGDVRRVAAPGTGRR